MRCCKKKFTFAISSPDEFLFNFVEKCSYAFSVDQHHLKTVDKSFIYRCLLIPRAEPLNVVPFTDIVHLTNVYIIVVIAFI